MKTKRIYVSLLVALSLVVSAGAAVAQNADQVYINANIYTPSTMPSALLRRWL